MPVPLTKNQEELKQKLVELLKEYYRLLGDHQDVRPVLRQLSETAWELHTSLSGSGHEPRHHEYMVANRGGPPKGPEFYFHIHPVEDLLAFINGPGLSSVPVDPTVGHEFELRVFSRRWRHDDVYKLKRTQVGWQLTHPLYSGLCDKGGRPLLFEALHHDSIQYPADLDDRLQWLWTQARDRNLTHQQVQDAMDQLAKWMRTVEAEAPQTGVWEGSA